MVRKAVLLPAMMVAACSSTSVDKSRQQVTDSLMNMPPQSDVMSYAKMMPDTDYSRAINAEGVVWTFRLQGKPLCRFQATIEEAGPAKASVSTRIENLSDSNDRALCAMAKIVGDESVAATLEGRNANYEAIRTQLVTYVAMDPAAMQQAVGKQTAKMFNDVNEQMRAMDDMETMNAETFKRDYAH